ncbi:Protein jim lovell [Halotydeus destructor]|nr:Protein jim lovell [Halotydeus destructor]
MDSEPVSAVTASNHSTVPSNLTTISSKMSDSGPSGPNVSPAETSFLDAYQAAKAASQAAHTSGSSSSSPSLSSSATPPSGTTTAPSPSSSLPALATGKKGPLKLTRVNHLQEIVSGFSRLLETESMTDVTLSCQGGLNIRAHRVILATFSPYFRAIFETQTFSETPWHYPVIVMKDYGYTELKAIIEFIYTGGVSVPRDRLPGVLQAARALQVSGLSDLKLESFGVAATELSSALLANSSPPPPLTMGGLGSRNSGRELAGSMAPTANGLGLLGSGLTSSPSAASKRSTNMADMETIYGGNGSDPSLAKKLRITLDSDVTSSSLINNFNSNYGGGGIISDSSLDGVRSLLQQPPRLPQVFQQLRQQQNSLQQLALGSNGGKRTSVSLQQLMQQRALQNQQQSNSLNSSKLLAAANGPSRHLQMQQQQLKQQILQQQLLRNSNATPKTSQASSGFGGTLSSLRGQQSVQFLQFQQRIRQQFQDKNKASSNLHDRLSAVKPLLHKQLQQAKDNQIKREADSPGLKHGAGDDEEVIIEKDIGDQVTTVSGDKGKEADGHSNHGDESLVESIKKEKEVNSSGDSGNGTSGGDDDPEDLDDGQGEDMESGAVQLTVTHDDEDGDDGSRGGRQIQRQQQLAMQHMEQEEQEQRLLEYHQSLTMAAAAAAAAAAAHLDNDSSQGEHQDDGDAGSGFGFDWKEGYADELPYTANNATLNENQSTGGQTQVPSVATPDFLQPRGPGRPRKGNKPQEISPCPECNKVFVRPDVLKLHYRSVHLNERHPCNLCPKIFKWPGDLSKHKRTKHPDKIGQANANKGQTDLSSYASPASQTA